MRVLHKHAHHHPLLSFPRVKSEFTLGKLWVYPTQTPSLLRPIWKCINMHLCLYHRIDKVHGICETTKLLSDVCRLSSFVS